MRSLSRFLALALTLAVAAPAAAHAVTPPAGPRGDAFYAPPASLVRGGPPGSIVWARTADPLVRVPGARRTITVLHRSRAIDGTPNVASASVAFPRADPPAGGWRTVVWNHVTTGAADSCAPTRTREDSPEREKMTRADPMVRALLEAGFVVVRPDYEGLGTPGGHPYLVGRSLARTSVDAFRAARAVARRIGPRWLVAGHSEGGQAALFTGALGRAAVPGTTLEGVVAMAPPTHMRDYFALGPLIPVAGPGVAELSTLAGLILHGAALAEPRLARLYREGALSDRALALLPHLEERCFLELGRRDSWGGLAPAAIPGPRLDAARELLYRVLDESDPRAVRIPAGLPVRLDQGVIDPVVPVVFTEELVAGLRRGGTDVTYRRYPTATHQNITAADQAVVPATAWIAARLR
ncbi:lipase family protein [Paraconexibacter algicola]|uniref:Lipase n=1 Tax=Paraconexibacter algicola TaxID=2133960 RepID=A0A2T4UJK4_9ACTN|nr:lipase family protein [Paraconexibacter algicola]PTL59423.1 lipase [Paraconexibacter algicola]